MIGGNSPIAVQSMTNTDSHDFESTYRQMRELEEAGCDIVRLTLPDVEACETVAKLKKTDLKIPLVGDIHFNYKVALAAAEAGIDKIRINPGNIGSDEKIKAVADKCKAYGIPIRIGVNSGSLEKHILEKYGAPVPAALAESAMYHAGLLEKFGFEDIAISIKSSNVRNMIEANRIVASQCDYPLHIGVTEAGRGESGTLKSAIGIGTLLCEGIGDTIRVSLTDDPVLEVETAREILRACGLDKEYVEVVSCPTCGRCAWNSTALAEKVTAYVKPYKKQAKIAVMGCVVNGPGEAKDADLGIAGGENGCLIFKKGEPYKKVNALDAEQEFLKEVKELLDE
jgi:(E)-4-hydroxy-3-methylbut-2-enyl-diphosphate synthase